MNKSMAYGMLIVCAAWGLVIVLSEGWWAAREFFNGFSGPFIKMFEVFHDPAFWQGFGEVVALSGLGLTGIATIVVGIALLSNWLDKRDEGGW